MCLSNGQGRKGRMWRSHRALDGLPGRLRTGPYPLLEARTHLGIAGLHCNEDRGNYQRPSGYFLRRQLHPTLSCPGHLLPLSHVNTLSEELVPGIQGKPCLVRLRTPVVPLSCLCTLPLGPQVQHPSLSGSLVPLQLASSQP